MFQIDVLTQVKKRFFCICFILSLIITSIYSEETIISVFKDSYKATNIELCLENGLKKLNVDLDSEIPAEKLAAINFILKNTYEINIHRMRGEEDNQVYTKNTGEEAVFDKDGNLVTNDWNHGSYNYGTYEKPIQKFELDIWPWLVWGNTREDPTTFDERFYYYLMDLDSGIQQYIILEKKSDLEEIKYSDLNKTDKLVYHFFYYLLFNKNYKSDLSEKNIKKYKKNANNYWKYLSQIAELAGYTK